MINLPVRSIGPKRAYLIVIRTRLITINKLSQDMCQDPPSDHLAFLFVQSFQHTVHTVLPLIHINTAPAIYHSNTHNHNAYKVKTLQH